LHTEKSTINFATVETSDYAQNPIPKVLSDVAIPSDSTGEKSSIGSYTGADPKLLALPAF
jgi:hypothetical protein